VAAFFTAQPEGQHHGDQQGKSQEQNPETFEAIFHAAGPIMNLKSVFLWAHRGFSAQAPENTLAAFSLAEAAGADGIELDVHLSREKVPMVIHDETVDRTTDGRGVVADLTVRQLQSLDAGSWFSGQFAAEAIPTLEEVFQWAGDRLRLNLEIKSAAAGKAVLDLLDVYAQVDVLVSSFDHDLLSELHRCSPALPLAFLCDSHFWRRPLKRAIACEARAFHPSVRLVSRPLINAARHAGLAVHAWTVDDPGTARNLLRRGCSGLFTNNPGKLQEIARIGENFLDPSAHARIF